MPPHIANFLLGSFGIVAAVLLIGGSIALRMQRNRHRFELSKRAIESGAPLPEGPPAWLASRRQALSILALGVGLLIVGGGAWWLGSGAARPAGDDAPPPPPIASLQDPLDPRGRPRPPAPSPEIEAWHSAQYRVAVGQTAAGCGVILTILGLVRLGYTGAERRYSDQQTSQQTSVPKAFA